MMQGLPICDFNDSIDEEEEEEVYLFRLLCQPVKLKFNILMRVELNLIKDN